MKKFLAIALGVMTAVGGFVDIGDIVTSSLVGARFGMALAWAVVLGAIGIIVYAEMAGRVAAVSGRPVFELVRERLGARIALVNLAASVFVNFLTLTAEIAGVSIALQLATSVNYLIWLPISAFLVWFAIWRVKFSALENVFGLLGLTIAVFLVALVHHGTHWETLWHQASHPTVPHGEGRPTFFYYAIALFGSAMTPYEVVFFSSGAVEERWTKGDLSVNRANVFLGFPLGATLSLGIMAAAAVFLQPESIAVNSLGQVGLPVALALGKVGLAVMILSFFIVTFGASLETGLSSGYTAAQYFGWQWGKFVRPREAPRFHLIVLGSIVGALILGLTALDPVKITEFSVVLSAAALPLTYFPILVVANDRTYMGDKVNRAWSNSIALVFLVIVLVASIATIPLMIITKAGQ